MKWFIGFLRRYEKKDWRFPPYRWQMGCSRYLKYLISMREMGKINICFTYTCKCIRKCFLLSVHGMQVMQINQCYYRELQLFTSQLDSSIFHYNSRKMYVYGRMSRPQLQRIIKHTASHRNPFSIPSKCQPSAQETQANFQTLGARPDETHNNTTHGTVSGPGQELNKRTKTPITVTQHGRHGIIIKPVVYLSDFLYIAIPLRSESIDRWWIPLACYQ